MPLAAVAAQIGFGISLVLTEDGTRARHVLEVLHVAGAEAVWASLVAVAAFLGLPSRLRSAVGVQRRSSHGERDDRASSSRRRPPRPDAGVAP